MTEPQPSHDPQECDGLSSEAYQASKLSCAAARPGNQEHKSLQDEMLKSSIFRASSKPIGYLEGAGAKTETPPGRLVLMRRAHSSVDHSATTPPQGFPPTRAKTFKDIPLLTEAGPDLSAAVLDSATGGSTPGCVTGVSTAAWNPIDPNSQGQQGTSVQTDDATPAAPAARLPTQEPRRVLQLKAKFERPRQAVTDSELHHTCEESPVGPSRRDRRQSDCPRHTSPHEAEVCERGSQTVRDMKYKFEHHLRKTSPAESESRGAGQNVSSRRIAAEKLMQLGAMDIAARYGKPYRRPQKLSDEQGTSAGSGLPLQAPIHADDKRADEVNSPVVAATQRKKQFSDEGRDATGDGLSATGTGDFSSDGFSSESHAAVRTEKLPTEGQGGSSAVANDDGDSSHGAKFEDEKAEAESPSAMVRGRPSAEIGRLAALVAAGAQNYGKPVPRRLLTRQDTDPS